MRDDELPVVFRSSDTASLTGQRRYIRGTKWRLVLAVAAAVCGVLNHRAAFLALVAVFVATILVEFWLLAERPEEAWYDGRALAESTKTLAWRYAVGGAPFPADLPEAEAQLRFLERLRDLLREAPATSLAPMGSAAVTDAMNGLRAQDFDARKKAYVEQRVENQLRWYTAKAQANVVRARRWRLILIAVEGLGLTAAVLRLTGVLDFDLAGVLAAVLGAGSAWFAVRQYETLGRAYTFAATELSIIHDRLSHTTPASWAQEVADAEEAISREHTMWRASRGAG
ncbi:membrane protein [Streptomyces resistomycificus]|uniref:Membrane protein n=1 Tax=Streptomyces resistomycificus TaxID=67356 RepID=A0A0L8LFH6_9ACTN|nr:membrane protein [Streptomyces resistomycificus]